MKIKFTKQQIEHWKAYEAVRKSGAYNMLMQATQASEEAGLTKDEYYFALCNFSELKQAARQMPDK